MTTPKTISAEPTWLVNGYREAVARFDKTQDSEEAEKRFIPLFEALDWAAAIVHPDAPNRLLRRKDNDDTILGLQFARNRVHHQWGRAIYAKTLPNPAVTTAAGSGTKIVMPPTRIEWFWNPVRDLPRERGPTETKLQENCYTVHLENEPVRDALAHLDGLLLY